MKILKPIVSRFTMVTVALLMQIGVMVLMSTYFESIMIAARIAIGVVSFIVVCIVLNQVQNSAIALTWIIFILTFPIFGSMLYLLVGGKRPGRKMRKRFEKASAKKSVKRTLGMKEELFEENENVYYESMYLKRQGFPVYKNTSVKYFPLGDDAFPAMLEAIESAKEFIFMEYFILDKGEMLEKIIDVLERKAKEGVDVRVIYDDMGSLFTLPHNYPKILSEKGIKCLDFNPYVPVVSAIMNHRDHRKILVVDSRIAFTGGINIADEYINKKEKYGHWKDNAIMLTGEGVNGFTLMFLEMWRAYKKDDTDISRFLKFEKSTEGAGYVQPFFDTPVDDELVGENVYMQAIASAKRYIYIFTPYLIPDRVLVRELTLAAKRGVDVKIMVPGIPDKKMVYSITKSHFGPLLKKGVKIYKYTPGFLHAKGFVCDDSVAFAGTVNVDYRSMYHHFECGCIMYNTPSVFEIKDDFLKTLKKCEKVEKSQRLKGVIGTTYHALVRLISPMM